MEGCDRSERLCGLLFSLSHTGLPPCRHALLLLSTSQVYLFRSPPPALHSHLLFHLLILFPVAVSCLSCLLLVARRELSASPLCRQAEASSGSARVSLTSSLLKKKKKRKENFCSDLFERPGRCIAASFISGMRTHSQRLCDCVARPLCLTWGEMTMRTEDA